jgi:hypothetical protein
MIKKYFIWFFITIWLSLTPIYFITDEFGFIVLQVIFLLGPIPILFAILEIHKINFIKQKIKRLETFLVTFFEPINHSLDLIEKWINKPIKIFGKLINMLFSLVKTGILILVNGALSLLVLALFFLSLGLFFGGIAVIGYQIYSYLKHGSWISKSLLDIYLDYEVHLIVNLNDWVGIIKILEFVPLSLTLIFLAVVIFLFSESIKE